MRDHLVNNCLLVNQICNDCEQRYTRVDLGNHSLLACRILNKALKLTIAQRDAVIAAFEETKNDAQSQLDAKEKRIAQ